MSKTESVELRLSPPEKEGFRLAAEMAGVSLSGWIRERLRKAAAVELESAGRKIPFFKLPSESCDALEASD